MYWCRDFAALDNPRQGWISPDVFIPIAEEHI